MDRRRRPRLRAEEAAGLRAAGRREGAGRDRRHRPVHHAERRQGLAVRAGRAWPTGRCRRTTSRPSRRCANALYGVQSNPAKEEIEAPYNRTNPSVDDVYPYVFTTYRLTEHHTAGAMSRTLPYLAELQPEFFVEVSPQLAEERGLENGGWATVVTARAAVEARVLVTERIRPLKVGRAGSCTRSASRITGAARASRPATRATT